MTISKNNTRVIITLPKELHEKIKKMAELENRTITNFIVTLIKNAT